MEAVTTCWREWRGAAMAPARSVQCMRRPPRSAFKTLASLGRTISVISEVDSRTGRGRINFALSLSFIDCQCIGRLLVDRALVDRRRVDLPLNPSFINRLTNR